MQIKVSKILKDPGYYLESFLPTNMLPGKFCSFAALHYSDLENGFSQRKSKEITRVRDLE